MNSEKAKVIVYENGDILNIDSVKELLFKYWELSKAEKRSFKIMTEKYPNCPDKYKKFTK